MKRDRVVEIMIDIKRLIDLNKESIRIQEKEYKGGISEYLKGWNDGITNIYNILAKES